MLSSRCAFLCVSGFVLGLVAAGCSSGGGSEAGDVGDGSAAEVLADASSDLSGTQTDGSSDLPVGQTDVVGDLAPDAPAADPSDQIAAIRAAIDAAASLPITGEWEVVGVTVTATRAALGNDPAGFFVQASAEGPALFVMDEIATPQVGDTVAFTVVTAGKAQDVAVRAATEIGGVTVLGSGVDLTPWVQELSAVDYTGGNLDAYECELVSLTTTLIGDFGFAGDEHGAASVSVSGGGDGAAVLRVPNSLLQAHPSLGVGCSVDVGPTPLWRYQGTAQPSAFVADDLTVLDCPAPQVVSAAQTDPAGIVISMSAAIAPFSVLDDGSQFQFSGSALATYAFAIRDKVFVRVELDADAEYSVVVAPTVTDTLGAGVTSDANSAVFTTIGPRAAVSITEVAAAVPGGCDLIELRVAREGSMAGTTLYQRSTPVYEFEALQVGSGDRIVVHIDAGDPNCVAPGAVDETVAKNESTASTSFEFAWDMHSMSPGLTATDNVFWVRDGYGQIADAVLMSDGEGTTAFDSEVAAKTIVDALAWWPWPPSAETLPGYIFVDGVFHAHAVHGLESSDGVLSLQRLLFSTSRNLGDWTKPRPASFGLENDEGAYPSVTCATWTHAQPCSGGSPSRVEVAGVWEDPDSPDRVLEVGAEMSGCTVVEPNVFECATWPQSGRFHASDAQGHGNVLNFTVESCVDGQAGTGCVP